jgi:hypothetical protein
MGKWFLLEWEFNDNPTTLTIWADGQKSMVTEGGQKVDVSTFRWPKGSGTGQTWWAVSKSLAWAPASGAPCRKDSTCTTTISPSIPSASVLFASRRSGARPRLIPRHDFGAGTSRAKRVLLDHFRAHRHGRLGEIGSLSSAELIQGGLAGAAYPGFRISAPTGARAGFYSHIPVVIYLCNSISVSV